VAQDQTVVFKGQTLTTLKINQRQHKKQVRKLNQQAHKKSNKNRLANIATK
jgi:hypothetical protein